MKRFSRGGLVLFGFFAWIPQADAVELAPSPSAPVAASSATLDLMELGLDQVQLLEQEFDPALLENLPTPTTPPPKVSLPPLVIKKDQWKGSQCGITKSAHAVIRKAEVWDKFWNLVIRPYSPHVPPTPPVDFTKDMVVAVFMGEQPYPNAQIEIRSVRLEPQGAEDVIAVKFKNMHKMQAVFSPPFPVQPFHLLKTKANPGRVFFQDIKAQ